MVGEGWKAPPPGRVALGGGASSPKTPRAHPAFTSSHAQRPWAPPGPPHPRLCGCLVGIDISL